VKILALESSCDDTACAIVEDGRTVLASLTANQIETHLRYGGVIPELAARSHALAINGLIEKALEHAQLDLSEMDAFAGTLGPGLIGSLLVGANTAKTLSLIANKPFIGVNHLHGHIASNYLESTIEPPLVCLIVSGGHTQLAYVASYNDVHLCGETLDDAVGEVYDKLAREMGFGFPGGAILDKRAALGDASRYALPIAKTANPYDFSFSGLKTAVLRLWQEESSHLDECDVEARQRVLNNLAASFQKTVVNTLMQKLLKLAEEKACKTLCLAGGVSANSALRKAFHQLEAEGFTVQVPKMAYSTDNAAMIGASAYFNPISTEALNHDVFSRLPQVV
jgi:N6-L-threonylcarbamoyladenine synthase